MNVAFLHRRYDCAGGTERDLYELVTQFLQFGHQVHLYCGQYRIPPQEGAVPHYVPYLRAGETAKLLSFASLAPRAAAVGHHDIIIGFSKVFRQDIIRCGGGTHKQFLHAINQVRSPLRAAMKWPKDRAALHVERKQFQAGNYRRIIAVSNLVKNELVQVYQVPEHTIDVIYDGVDTKIFSPENRNLYRSSIRRMYTIGENDVLLLFVGSGFLRKGLEFLLRAMAEMRRPDIKLLVVGNDSNSERFREMAARLGIEDAVVFAGLQNEVQRFYGAADLLVLPSVQEAFGNVVLEAMASGLPVITTKNAGASEILEGELGNYVLERPDEIKKMAGMINELLNADLRIAFPRTARAAAEHFTFEANARAVENVCLNLLKEKLSAARG